MDASFPIYYYIAFFAAAIMVILLASLASYLTELRDEIENNGTTIEQSFSWGRLAVSAGIAVYFSILGIIGCFAVISFFTDFDFLTKASLSVGAGSFVGFVNRLVIVFAKQNLPALAKEWISKKR